MDNETKTLVIKFDTDISIDQLKKLTEGALAFVIEEAGIFNFNLGFTEGYIAAIRSFGILSS